MFSMNDFFFRRLLADAQDKLQLPEISMGVEVTSNDWNHRKQEVSPFMLDFFFSQRSSEERFYRYFQSLEMIEKVRHVLRVTAENGLRLAEVPSCCPELVSLLHLSCENHISPGNSPELMSEIFTSPAMELLRLPWTVLSFFFFLNRNIIGFQEKTHNSWIIR